MDFDTAHEIGLKFAEYFQGHQCVVVTHMNTQHIHNHIVMNSVNFETGKKFHQSAKEMKQAKEFNNQLCLQYGLSITETKADRNQIPKWKKKLRDDIKRAMERSRSQQEFISLMNSLGYQVKWEANHKHITYTTPENYRCRDSKLFDATLLRENMELYFEMGGCEYLESCMDRCEYGDPIPTVDDVVCELASIIDSLIAGDAHRFHLETVHHSKREILMMLRKGKKIQHTRRVVDDGPEYEQYHGFSMTM